MNFNLFKKTKNKRLGFFGKIDDTFEIKKRFNKKLQKTKGWFSWSHQKHNHKIRQLRKTHAYIQKPHQTYKRVMLVFLATVVVFYLIKDSGLQEYLFGNTNPASGNNDQPSGFINLIHLIYTAPILFFAWLFRDQNRLKELANNRKDTNLKEFQQLQQWATGNITDCADEKAKTALQISALHSLRAYLKGEFGQDFRRGAYEIFASALQTQHQEILKQVAEEKDKTLTIPQAIEKNELCKQLNRIANEDWFNLLINHDFPTATISLLGVDLHGVYLKHQDFNQILDLTQANLQGADLQGANLQGADLWGANLQGVDLVGAKLQGADLRSANLQGANLWGANLQGADLRSANLQGADLQGANLQGADLWGANLQGADLQGANLQGADLWGANLQGVDLVGAKLQGADLRSANLQGADLQGANLQGADLWGAKLQGADLRSANLQGANLWGANLQGADLRSANLQGADLRSANLQGADLQGANLQGADLWGAKLQGANLRGAKLQGVYVSKEFENLTFEQRIKQQTNQETATQALQAQYQPLTEAQKSSLVSTMKDIDNHHTKVAILHINESADVLDLTSANTGSYDEEQAQQWIDEYNEKI